MTHVLISSDDDAFAAARRSDPDAVVMDLDEPFEQVVVALMPHRTIPGPGFLAQAHRNAAERDAFLDAHGALTAEQVADFARSTATNRRQTAHRWVSDRMVFAVDHSGQRFYPTFQFDLDTRRPRPAIKDVLARLPDALAGWALALWWDTPTLLDDEWVVPVELVDQPGPLARLADVEAAGWRRDGAT